MSAPPLVAQGLRRSFAGHVALDGLDLDVGAGEVHAVVGLNGAGKTTLFRLLLGMLRPGAGRARVLGVDAAEATRALWRRVGHLVEAPLAYPELTVRENLTGAALLHGLAAGEADAAVTTWVERLALEPWLDRRAAHLSTGNRQRLGLAAALVHDPEVLVLDEPAKALDPFGVVLVREVVQELRAGGAAVLVSSHHLDQLARVADRITVLHRGRHVGSLEPGGVDLEQAFFELVHAAERGVREVG
jgi:ABC-2 type transport system ATP-binding protein